MIGLLLLKHIYGLSDEGVGDRRVYDPYFNLAQLRTLAIDQVSGRPKDLVAIDEAPNFLENQVRFLMAGCAQPHRASAARR